MSIANDPAKKNFLRNLAETIAWCQPRAVANDPASICGSEHGLRKWLEADEHDEDDDRWKSVLRSEELRPPVAANDQNDDGVSLWADRKMVEHVIAERRRLVTPRSATSLGERHLLNDGRLLALFPNYSNINCMSAWATGYFLDENDSPPWDTWVDIIRTPPIESKKSFDELLVAWIPPDYIEIVNLGIETEIIDILMWVDEPISCPVPEECIPKWLRSLVADSR